MWINLFEAYSVVLVCDGGGVGDNVSDLKMR